jgi:hypothetical protein
MTTSIDPAVRQALNDVVLRYATGIDTRDWALLRSCFTEDCQADYGDVGKWDTGNELCAFMEKVHADCGHTLHRMLNQVVRPDGDGFTSRTYGDAIVMRADNRKGLQMHGYYDDRLVLTDQGWQISRRVWTAKLTVRVVAFPESE